jgi:hypothetical protein
MHRLLALALLWPFSGQAQGLFVDYEGVVNQADDNPLGYRVGDKVRGRLLIDFVLAPPELFPNTSELASYHYLPWEPQRDWVRGYSGEGGVAADRIFVTNRIGDDWFSIGDRRDERSAGFRGVEMTVGGIEMFTSNHLDELDTFSVTRKNNPAAIAGYLQWGWGETLKHVAFALKSFRVTPAGRCKAPA